MHGGPLASGHGLIALSAGPATLEVAPAAGGGIASFYWTVHGKRRDWLRPASGDDIVRGDAGSMGCFPLVPYSNRIRDGRFSFGGRTVVLPATPPADPHFEHGHGWRRAWTVADLLPQSIVLALDHAADAWPWHYEARQEISLTDGGALDVALSVTNRDARPMPAGLGLHPYFPKTPRTRLTAGVERMWAIDAEVLPTDLVSPSPGANPNTGMAVAAADLDNAFTGWTRVAEITWPEHRARLRLEAEGSLRFLVLYTPPAESYFCAEPVSNATDAFNLASAGRRDTGMAVLAPGESLRSVVSFTPELTA